MKTLVMLMALVFASSGMAFAANAPGQHTPTPYMEVVPGVDVPWNVVVYTDDCYGYDYILDALAQLGLGYTLYYMDPYGFEAAVASGAFDAIFVNHECYFECSYAWDNIVTAIQGGAVAVIATFDWDGSNDYSGYVDELLALAQHTEAYDIQTQTTVYVWNVSPIFVGCPSGTALPAPGSGYYIDEGDSWNYLTAESGWVTAPTPGQANCNWHCVPPLMNKIVFIAFTMDELTMGDAVTIWKNAIGFVLSGPSATEHSTWGAVKSLYE